MKRSPWRRQDGAPTWSSSVCLDVLAWRSSWRDRRYLESFVARHRLCFLCPVRRRRVGPDPPTNPMTSSNRTRPRWGCWRAAESAPRRDQRYGGNERACRYQDTKLSHCPAHGTTSSGVCGDAGSERHFVASATTVGVDRATCEEAFRCLISSGVLRKTMKGWLFEREQGPIADAWFSKGANSDAGRHIARRGGSAGTPRHNLEGQLRVS